MTVPSTEKLDSDPRVEDNSFFMPMLKDWMRKAARIVNSFADMLSPFSVENPNGSYNYVQVNPPPGGTGAYFGVNRPNISGAAAFDHRTNSAVEWRLGTFGGSTDYQIRRMNPPNVDAGWTMTIGYGTGITWFQPKIAVQNLGGSADILLQSNSGSKTVRCIGNSFGIVNSAYTSDVFTVDDGGNTICNGTLTASYISAANGMRMAWDGGNSNFLGMGAGATAAWNWQWLRSTGMLNWLGSAAQVLFQVDGNGYVGATGPLASSSGSYSALYAPSGGVIVGLPVQSENGGANGNCAFQARGWAPSGPSYYAHALSANPNWGTVRLVGLHYTGVWAGWLMDAVGGQKIEFILSGSGWGSIRAASFDVQSDERIKRVVAPLPQAHAAFMGIKPISWHWPESNDAYSDAREKWGFSAQNMAANVPLAVNGDVTAEDANGKPVSASVDPIPIVALTVLEVQALWARLEALEGKI